jgi:periplasmic divalent cation tolerance protein
MASSDAIIVFMTASSRDEAHCIADALVEKQLAACVQILPEMQSVFRWQGKVERVREVLLTAKTTAERFAELEREVKALHSYDTPEIVAIPLSDGSKPYLDWLRDNVR